MKVCPTLKLQSCGLYRLQSRYPHVKAKVGTTIQLEGKQDFSSHKRKSLQLNTGPENRGLHFLSVHTSEIEMHILVIRSFCWSAIISECSRCDRTHAQCSAFELSSSVPNVPNKEISRSETVWTLRWSRNASDLFQRELCDTDRASSI